MNSHAAASAASSSGRGDAAPRGSALLDNFTNFKISQPPSRIMFRTEGSWVDFDADVSESLRAGFSDRRMTVEVSVAGSACLVDFARMQISDLATGEERPIAWVDATGRAFFPKGSAILAGCRPELGDPLEERSDESPEVSSVVAAGGEERGGDCYMRNVGGLFASEMRRSGREVSVSSVRRCAHTGPIGAVRLRAFQARVECMRAVRGNANVRGAWYAGALEELEGIVRYGFGRSNSDRLGGAAHGAGVHLIPPQSLHSSCVSLPDADPSGERHLLFCRVIMGVPEMVARGSTQFQPSDEQFDSAVDDFQSPRWYIVWSTHMNTHIIPECVVSYRMSGHRPQGMMQTRKGVFAARRMYPPAPLTFLHLYAEMAKLLPPSKMKTLDILFDRYKAKKVQKEIFVRHLRSIAGTDVICEAIRKVKDNL